jgi:hypothetical protein
MRQRSLPSLAMALTIRDEERFLAANLAYHRALGVSRAYVFLDRCADASRQIAQSFPWVQTLDQDRPPEVSFMAAHHARSADIALELARGEGFEWLMYVDADEFAFGDGAPGHLRWARNRRPSGLAARPETLGSLPRMLTRVRPTTEQVVLSTKEVVPTPLKDGEPFWSLHYFQVRPAWEGRLLDPTSGEVRRLKRWLGHRMGKGIVRTSADVRSAGPHRWKPSPTGADTATTRVPTEHRGSLYHFYVVSAAHWREKHSKHAEYPDHWWRGGSVGFPRQAWKEASLAMSDAEARAYYDRWVMVQPRHLLWPRLRGHVVRDTVVETVLAESSSCPSLP